MFPQTKPTGKDEATAVRDDVKVLEARMPHWLLEPAGVTKWGESSDVNYRDYVDFLHKWGVIKQKVDTPELITNELIDDVNKLDVAKVAAEAKAYRYSRERGAGRESARRVRESGEVRPGARTRRRWPRCAPRGVVPSGPAATRLRSSVGRARDRAAGYWSAAPRAA